MQADIESRRGFGKGCPSTQNMVWAASIDSDYIDLGEAPNLQKTEGLGEVAGRIV
jgi:hypothetical protein